MHDTLKNISVKVVPERGAVITFWNVAARTRLNYLDAGLMPLGLSDCVPTERTHMACLKDAIKSVAQEEKHKFIIADLDDKSGYAMVGAMGGAAIGSSWGQVERVFKLNIDSQIGGVTGSEFTPDDDFAAKVRAVHHENLNWVTAVQVGKTLADAAKALGGVMLKPGVYSLMDEKMDLWDKVANVVSQSAEVPDTSHVVIVAHRLTFATVKAILESLIKESLADLERISEEVANLDGKLGKRALQTREAQAMAIVDKLGTYEQYLQVDLTNLKDTARGLKTAAAMAALKVSAEEQAEVVGT